MLPNYLDFEDMAALETRIIQSHVNPWLIKCSPEKMQIINIQYMMLLSVRTVQYERVCMYSTRQVLVSVMPGIFTSLFLSCQVK